MTTANALYAFATVLSWVGWISGVTALWILFKMIFDGKAADTSRGFRSLAISSLLAGGCLLVTALIPMHESAKEGHGFRVPIVWFVMPFSAWLATCSVAMALYRVVQGLLGLNAEDRLERLKAAGIWVVVAVAFVGLYRHDPTNKIDILTGGLWLVPQTLAAIVFLAGAGMAAMVIAGRATKTRGYARTIVTQAALLAGSVIFGLPFAFLVITSFKEDRDMSSPNGIVWVPRVQDTVPYFDKKKPVYEGTYAGQTVQGTPIATNPDGTIKIDISKPMAIRGTTFSAQISSLKVVPVQIPIVSGVADGVPFEGKVIEEMDDGHRRISFLRPPSLAGKEQVFAPADVQPVRHIGLRWENYSDALNFLPPETDSGLVYLKNTLILVVMSVLGTILSSSIVAYAFSRMRFPGRDPLFAVLLSTMMLPAAVTLLPQFLIFRYLGWIDTLYPLWVPAFFASAFNVFLLRQFFKGIPMELEDAAKIDGCSYAKTFWSVMLPQIKPALAVIAVWTFMGAWNNFMGPLIYVNSPENMPLSYALQLFQGDRGGEPGLMMAFATMCILPVLAVFFFAQRYFIEGVTLSGLGGR
ncbi:MAG: carbohydrate ABC transporter permease [Fimbriimonas sp.]|nr:carbohydrate ABC transporter permease [Fimbriimonas sp.]